MTWTAHALLAVLCVFGVRAVSPFCPTLHADFTRRQQNAPFNEAAPYNESDGEKHTPYITIVGTLATVTVGDGNPYHPMTASDDPSLVHFITHIYVENQDGDIIFLDALDPTMGVPATTTFNIPTGTTTLKAYEWCNQHGLWEGPEVSVSTTESSVAACSKDDLDVAAYPSYDADLRRRQSMTPWNEDDPYVEADGKKHTPYIEVLNSSHASVTVGEGTTEGPYHPMVDSSNPNEAHFVTHIYVVDQDGNIVAMQNMDPEGVTTATMTFEIPGNATQLTAHEFCNLHGLWQGPTVNVNAAGNSNVNAAFRSRVVMSLAIAVVAALIHPLTV